MESDSPRASSRSIVSAGIVLFMNNSSILRVHHRPYPQPLVPEVQPRGTSGYHLSMANRQPIVAAEWYHCFNRGVDKRLVFLDEDDCERLQALFYLCNEQHSSTHLIDLGLRHIRLEQLIKRKVRRGLPLIDIGAYALMPNHIHLIARPLFDDTLSLFMQKVFTGYTLYFNKKYERTGPLFSGRYKSKHLDTDEYFKHAIQYVHLNPAELIEPNWKKGEGDIMKIEKELLEYRYASTRDFFGLSRPESHIIHDVRREYFDKLPKLKSMLHDAQAYYKENATFLDR